MRSWRLGDALAHVEQAHALDEARFNTEAHTYAFNGAVGSRQMATPPTLPTLPTPLLVRTTP